MQGYTFSVARHPIDTSVLITSPELQLRNFQWSDIEALSRLLNDAGTHGHRDWPDGIQDLRADLEHPRVRPEENVVLAEIAGEVVGYAIVEPEQNIGRSVIGIGVCLTNKGAGPGIHDREVAAAESLLGWAIGHASEIAPLAHLATRDDETGLRIFVEQRGWKQIRKYLKLVSESGPARVAVVIPTGFTVRTMLGLDELPELTQLQNESFKTHFGYSPNTEDEIKSRLLAPGASVGDVVMIHDGVDSGERLVAYCWTSTNERAGSKFGRIGMTGVLPEARGQGLGRAISESGFNHLLEQGVDAIELDVDSTNVPAMNIYSSLGFTTRSEVDWWEKSLQG